jgi:S-DNA-T family DNA segregation ATPase FtsK/SpoIIIE
VSLLINNNPDEVKLLFIDSRRIEFSLFSDIPHLISPVVSNARIAMSAFDWILTETEERKMLFAKHGTRKIDEYNSQADFQEKLPYIVVFVGELADLMLTFANKLQSAIARIAGLARLTGIHLVIASQRSSMDVISEAVKANIPNRIALKVLSDVDSINILGQQGAEKLLGRGDALFVGGGKSTSTRFQGIAISDDEITRLVEFWKSQVT